MTKLIKKLPENSHTKVYTYVNSREQILRSHHYIVEDEYNYHDATRKLI